MLCAILIVVAMLAMTPAALGAEADDQVQAPPAEEPVQEPAQEPAETPAPEEVPAPEETPVPTDTPAPTETPAPTDVPAPTETPAPTDAPAPAETPAPADAPAAASEPTERGEFTSDDPLYVKLFESPMTVAKIPGSFREVTPRRLKAGETLRQGVDVSIYQGVIDWNKVAAAGMDFAIVRVAGRGCLTGEFYNDSLYRQNLSGAKDAGLRVGAYFFSQAITVEEAREEARELLRLVRGYEIDLPLVFDYEYVDSKNARLYSGLLTPQEATDICNAFCREVEAAGYESMVYSNPTMLDKDLCREQLGRIWLAHWTPATEHTEDYEFWQFGIGAIDGIPYEVDLDYWFEPGAASAPPTLGPEVTPTPAPTPSAAPFTDVQKDAWFFGDVMAAYERGIVAGIGGGAFAPNNTATRAQTVTMLYRMVGAPNAPSTASFTDLTEDYYREAVNWAASAGVVNGVGDGQFAPNGSIAREQLAAMLYRLAGSPQVSGTLDRFSDQANASPYARDALIWALSKGVITGDSEGTLRPGATATRAEVCAMLMRYDRMAG